MIVDWTTAQWGFSLIEWFDLPQTKPAGDVTLGVFEAGLVFDASSHQDMSPLPVVTGLRLDLTCEKFDFGTDTRIELGLVPSASPAPFSNAAKPWTRNEVGLGVFSLTLPLFFTEVRFSFTLSDAAVELIETHCTGSPAWNGRVAISLRAAGAHFFVVKNYAPGQLITAVTTQEDVEQEEQAAQAPTGRFLLRVVHSSKPEHRRVSVPGSQAAIPRQQGIRRE